MPPYEYQCEHGGYRFERFQKMSEEPCRKYPGCDCHVHRLIGAVVASSLRARAFMPLTIEAAPQARSVGTHHVYPGHTPGEKHEKRGMP